MHTCAFTHGNIVRLPAEPDDKHMRSIADKEEMSMSKLKIGHTGITWPSDDDYAATVETIAKEGFGGIELFAWTLPKIEEQGRLDIFEQCGIPLWSAYFSHDILERGNMKTEFEKMKRSFEGKKVSLNVILIDLDGLKHINDNFGHGAGDNAIRVIATALKEACPEDALCVRFGGDEMLAVIPGESSPDEIKQDINRRITRYNNKECKPYLISASTGIYRTDSTQNTDFEYLVKEADAAMYAEKQEKRNQC